MVVAPTKQPDASHTQLKRTRSPKYKRRLIRSCAAAATWQCQSVPCLHVGGALCIVSDGFFINIHTICKRKTSITAPETHKVNQVQRADVWHGPPRRWPSQNNCSSRCASIAIKCRHTFGAAAAHILQRWQRAGTGKEVEGNQMPHSTPFVKAQLTKRPKTYPAQRT